MLEHPGASGIYTLSSSQDAFTARVLLADAAERSIDAQYYIGSSRLRVGKFGYMMRL
jgi:putative cardiolipin synthase